MIFIFSLKLDHITDVYINVFQMEITTIELSQISIIPLFHFSTHQHSDSYF